MVRRMIGCDNKTVRIPFNTHPVMYMLYSVTWNDFTLSVGLAANTKLKGNGIYVYYYVHSSILIY